MRRGRRPMPRYIYIAEAPGNAKTRHAGKVPAIRNEGRAVGVASFNGKNDGARTWKRSDASNGPSQRDIFPLKAHFRIARSSRTRPLASSTQAIVTHM